MRISSTCQVLGSRRLLWVGSRLSPGAALGQWRTYAGGRMAIAPCLPAWYGRLGTREKMPVPGSSGEIGQAPKTSVCTPGAIGNVR